MSRRSYLYGNLGGEDVSSKDVGKVRCPIWQCSGHLYLKTEKHSDGPKREDGWQMPSIKCDDCGTVFRNGMLDK